MAVRTKQTPDFWEVVEKTLGLQAPAWFIVHVLGDQKRRLERYGRPTGKLAESVPCINSPACAYHHVREHKGRYFAVYELDDRDCQTFELTHEQVEEWEIDGKAIVSEALKLVGVSPGEMAAPTFEATYHVGFVRRSGQQLPVYLVDTRERSVFRASATRLLATVDAPFIFMSLSTHAMDSVAVEGMRHHKCTFVPMEDLVAADDDGNLILLQRLEEEQTEVRTATDDNIFIQEGNVWRLVYGGVTVYVPDLKGLHYLYCLLASPNKVWSVEELESAATARTGRGPVGVVVPKDEDIDERTRKEYKNRLRELGELLEEAETDGDFHRQDELVAEREALLKEYAKRTHYGRPRKLSSIGEKLRVNIRQNINRAILSIQQKNAALGQHLDATIERGYQPSYRPDRPMNWQI